MREKVTQSLSSSIEIIPSKALATKDLEAILALCDRAYEQDLRPLFAVYPEPLHLVIREDSAIVSHACLIERWLQVANQPPMRTGFVEAVATDPNFQGRGHASSIMKRIMIEAERLGYEVGGLSTGSDSYYSRMGWELWSGPLSYRKDDEIILCPEERGAMIYKLTRTPKLDTSLPLSVEWRPGPEVW